MNDRGHHAPYKRLAHLLRFNSNDAANSTHYRQCLLLPREFTDSEKGGSVPLDRAHGAFRLPSLTAYLRQSRCATAHTYFTGSSVAAGFLKCKLAIGEVKSIWRQRSEEHTS